VRVTEVGSFAGTPAYGSPESAIGEEGTVDARSDLYSLGCVAFWLLTGRTVFEASTPMQMLMHHVHREPEPPSRCTELPVPTELDTLVLDLLGKEKDARPSSAAAVGERLDRIPLAQSWGAERARQWWERHRPQRGWPAEIAAPDGAVSTSLVQPLDGGTGS
jgi:serine/threonine-protein kinase